MDDAVLSFLTDPTPKYTGNFCIIIVSASEVTITHSTARSFPLYYLASNAVTNLPRLELVDERIPANCWVSLTHTTIEKSYIEYHTYKDNGRASVNSVATEIKNILVDKVHNTNILQNNIFAFISGGIDTWTIFALLKHTNIPYTLLIDEHFERTRFILKNHDLKSKHPQLWAYHHQIHHWRNPSVFATGGNGDESFMRGVRTGAEWCAWHDINLLDLVKNTDCYMQKYLLRDIHKQKLTDIWNNKHNIQQESTSYSELCNKTISFLSNDHQHWHLENTLTWTPLNDVRITKSILSLPEEDLLNQILHATVNRAVIAALDPNLLQYIDNYKNSNKYNNSINFPEIINIIEGK